MNNFEDGTEVLRAIYIDMGTTNTRVWLLQGGEILARAARQVGVRNSALDGTTAAIQTTLRELIAEVLDQANQSAQPGAPVCVVAAGMIGSSLGLNEVRHIPAPAGIVELAAATSEFAFPEVTALPFLIVPGVSSGSAAPSFRALDQDMMRGEETLCVGLQALDLLEPPAVVLTLGSHWKAIQISADGRVQGSVTSLSGEMIHAVQTGTILASAVGDHWPERMAPEWLEAGMKEQRQSDLPRALFSVRLLELKNQGTSADRFAYLLGAFIAADLDALVARGVLANNTRVVISGHHAIAEAWSFALARFSLAAVRLTEAETEKALLTGLHRILIEAISNSRSAQGLIAGPESQWRNQDGRNAAS